MYVYHVKKTGDSVFFVVYFFCLHMASVWHAVFLKWHITYIIYTEVKYETIAKEDKT